MKNPPKYLANDDTKKARKPAKKCKCGNPGTALHSCGYRSEINEDYDFRCNCCDNCVGECNDAI